MRTSSHRFVLPAALLFFFAAVGCRTARPAGNETPIASIAAPSNAAAWSELQARRASFGGARSLMRIRATSGDRTQSFRAQLQVDREGRMQLIAYTPVGTTAVTLFADREQVVFLNAIEGTAWRGSPVEFARSFGFFGPVAPTEMAMLLFGLPARSSPDVRILDAATFGTGSGVLYDVTPTGLARASLENGDDLLVVRYDPPSQPPVRVSVDHGQQKLEIEHLDLASSDAVLNAPVIPGSYRCCVPPHLP